MDKSLLGKLPIEVKLNIYERVLHVEGDLRITLNSTSSKYEKSRTKKAARRPERATSPQKNLLAIRATCKEAYLETDGIVSAVNHSWVFAHPDHNTTAWGKRARRWLMQVGLPSQRLVRSVKFDLGVWRNQRRSVNLGAHDVPNEAIAMWRHLPKLLQQNQLEHSIKLTVNWTKGMKLLGGGREMLGPCIYTIPMWGSRKAIWNAIHWRTEEQQEVMQTLARGWRDSWVDGEGEIPAFTSPPKFNRQAPRLYCEFNALSELSWALARACRLRVDERMYRIIIFSSIDGPGYVYSHKT